MINLHRKSNAATGVIRRPVGEVSCDLLPFKPGLSYCPPARGHWTIAHTPMLIPGSYMIYLCASACMRGVVLSALEDGGMDRFSMVILDDKDIYEGNLEQLMIDGISGIIDRLPAHPPIVMPFTSCIHHFLACDTVYIYEILRRKYPDIDFVQCYMIPTIRKGRITPEEQMQINLYDALERQDHPDAGSVNVLGCNFPSDPENDYIRMLTDAGYTVRDLPKTKTYREYKDMAESCANLYPYPVADFAAKKLEKRLGQKAIYIPVTYSYQEIREEMRTVADYFDVPLPDLDALQRQADEALSDALSVIGDTPIALDHEVLPKFCSLARLLIEHGFRVEEIYADSVLPGDRADLEWLQLNAPQITFCSAGNYACRLEGRNHGNYLAIGQKAAYFTGTSHMVNIIENGGLWGFHGIIRMARMMKEAFLEEKDVPSVIQVKAWGCDKAILRNQEACPAQRGVSAMKQVYNNLSTYSADLYGVNSALYELGGLLVMHDASGCNSTYNTHDEPRWWDVDSMVYVSGLDESDAILGNDDRLIEEITDVAEHEHPKFIGLTRSVLPTYMGTDLKGIARIIERRTGIPTFGFATNGMDTYIRGAGMAYRAVAERFCRRHSEVTGSGEGYGSTGGNRPVRSCRGRICVNVIGVTPLDFSANGNAQALAQTVKDMGFCLQSSWSMGCTLEELSRAPDGDVSLVVSADGIPAAEYLYKTYRIPYVVGIPCGRRAAEKLRRLLERAARTGNNASLFSASGPGGDLKADTPVHAYRRCRILVLGEAVHAASIRFQLENEYGYSGVKVLCPLEEDAGILRKTDLHCTDEESIGRALNSSDIVIADPVYRRITGEKVVFLDDPHDAYSGRMYHNLGRIFVGMDAEPFSELGVHV